MWKINLPKKNVLKIFALLSISLLFFVSCTDDSESYTYGVWGDRSDFDGLARIGASSFSIGNKGYICGGYTGKELLKDLWEYDMSGNYWTQCANMPDEASSRFWAVGFAVGSKGYITTGYNNAVIDYVADTWEYDPGTNTWTQKDDYAGGKRQEALAFAIGNYGYVGTGYDGNFLKDIYRFDPNAAPGTQWEIVNGFGGNKRRGGTAFVISNKAYIMGGVNSSGYPYDLWRFDPAASEQWVKLRDLADTSSDDYDDDYAGIVRANAISFVIDGRGYITTGQLSGTIKTDYWVYDPATDLWDSEDFTPFAGMNRYGSVAFNNGLRGFVATGYSGSYYLDDTWELLPYELEEE